MSTRSNRRDNEDTNGNTFIRHTRYYPQLHCSFCRRIGHRNNSCPIHLLSRLYTCINDDRTHDNICFKIIRNFSIDEITLLFMAIHEERNIAYSSDRLFETFLDMVPTIAMIFIEEENLFENENINRETRLLEREQRHQHNLNSSATANLESTNNPRFIQQTNIIEHQETTGSHREPSLNVVNQDPFTEQPLQSLISDFHTLRSEESIVLPSEDTIIETPETNEIIHSSNTTTWTPTSFNINLHSQSMENWSFPTLRSGESLNQILENEDEMPPLIDSNTFFEENDEYWRLPPFADMSGNIFSNNSNNLPTPRSQESPNIIGSQFVNNNLEDFQNNTSSSPIQVILNGKINIVPINVFTSTEETFCPVCYENLEEKKIVKTDCGHSFCFDCVTKFTKNCKNCPMCRTCINKLSVYMENLIV
jgi:hypothetical protein